VVRAKGPEESEMSTSIGCDAGGTFVEIYMDDDGGSGYGDHARVGRWYGSRKACEALAVSPTRLRREVNLYPWSDPERAVDAATQTGMYDRS
jgi:hypothetical protein